MIRPMTLVVFTAVLCFGCTNAGDGRNYDIVILGGRVMDPETELDAVRNVGIVGGEIAVVTTADISGRDTVDATGLVTAPGFIDLHAHAQDSVSNRLQALEVVTSAR